MAWNLQQEYNILNGLPLNDPVGFKNRCWVGIREIACDMIDRGFTLADAIAATPGFSINAAQFDNLSLRMNHGTADLMFMPMIVKRNNLNPDPELTTDAQIKTAIKKCVAPLASQIGNSW